MHLVNITSIILAINILPLDSAAAPAWINNGTKEVIKGQSYSVVCSGDGPAVDLARQEAISSCKSSIIDILAKEGRAKSIVVESDKETSFFSEVEFAHTFKNLYCKPEREEIEVDSSQSSYRVWLMCLFEIKDIQIESNLTESRNSLSRNDTLNRVPRTKFKSKQRWMSSTDKIVINLQTIPSCDRIFIKGTNPRSFKCASNPFRVIIYPEDTELILSAKGYIPKYVPLKNKGWKQDETVQIIFTN